MIYIQIFLYIYTKILLLSLSYKISQKEASTLIDPLSVSLPKSLNLKYFLMEKKSVQLLSQSILLYLMHI